MDIMIYIAQMYYVFKNLAAQELRNY